MAERRENIEELRRQVAQLRRVKPDANNRYFYANKTFTETAWEKYVKTFTDRLDKLEGGAQIRAENVAQQNATINKREFDRVQKVRVEVNELLTDFVQAFNRAMTVDDEDRLKPWRDYYQKKLADINRYLDGLLNGSMKPGDIDVTFQKYSPEQVTVQPGTRGAATAQSQSQAAAQPPATPDISTIKTEQQARTEIQNTRARINNLKNLVGEKQANGTVLYFEAPGMPGMSKMQRDAIIAGAEARISALNTKFFAETPAAGARPSQPATTAPAGGTATTTVPPGRVNGGAGFVPAPGQNVFGGTPIQPGSMGSGAASATTVDLSGVNFPETPADTTTTPSGTTGTTPGTVATPTPEPAGTTGGPTFTEPATGVTYRPGDRVGGEDRSLPNGGAVVDGVYVPPGVDFTWLANQVPEDWKTAAQELYGAYYDMIKNDPQISKLLEDAIKLGYSDAKFQAELEKTDWWRKTTANARQFQVLETTDPATARARLDNRIALVRETAQRMGVTLAATSLESIARNAINLGFDLEAQVEDLVGSEAIRSAGGVSQLRYGYVGDSIRESARKFGVALSDTTFNEWVNKIAVGAESQETFESYAQQISRTLYPSLAAGYDRGLSFSELTDPYAQQASRILEIPAAQVDFTDPKWAQAFTFKDEKGNPTQMSYGEWADYLRTDPRFGWEYTDDAKNRAYTVVNRLAELFGAA